MNRFTTYCLSLCIIGIASINQVQAMTQNDFIQSYSHLSNIKSKHIPLIYQAEENGSPAGRAVLRQARKTALEHRKIVKGSCWDYLDYVFSKAGFARNKQNRKIIFKGTLRSGPYIDTNKIQAGDWLYHINHSYHGIEHSGMFVGWVDKSKNKALMFSYAGQHRGVPARYRTYDLSHVYNVMRPSFGDTQPNYTPVNSNTLPITTTIIKKIVKSPFKPSPKPTPLITKDNNTKHNAQNENTENTFIQKYRDTDNINNQYLPIMYQAEQNSCEKPLKILQQARKMALETKEAVDSRSQHYMRVLFERVGMEHKDFFVGNRHKGGFMNPHKVKSGDWLSFINRDYDYSEHSGIFVGWLDKSKNTALIVSSGGKEGKDTAQYRAYDISHIYHVRRPTS